MVTATWRALLPSSARPRHVMLLESLWFLPPCTPLWRSWRRGQLREFKSLRRLPIEVQVAVYLAIMQIV